MIRFAHIDHLRLGSSIQGLSESPEWLLRAAAEAPRAAVRQLIQSVIRQDCDFLLIAGRVVESDAEPAGVVSWLGPQFAQLNERGISVVLFDHGEMNRELAKLPGVTLLSRSHWLAVTRSATGRVELRSRLASDGTDSVPLGIRADGSHESMTHSEMTYIAVPSSSLTDRQSSRSHNGILTASAGCPQSLKPAEQGASGMRVISADPQTRTIESRFVRTDSIWFHRFEIPVQSCSTPDGLIRRTLEILGREDVAQGRTLAADIVLKDMTWDCFLHPDCSGLALLEKLRRECRFGHNGVWPRSLSLLPLDAEIPHFVNDLARTAVRNAVVSTYRGPAGAASMTLPDRSHAAVARLQLAAGFLDAAP